MISLKNVNKIYKRGKTEVQVLKDCHLEIDKGDFVVIMGPSGSGKSTLLNLIGGIDQSDSGTILVNNHNIHKMNDAELTLFRREHIGIVFQFFNLLPTLSAVENIALPLLLSGEKYNSAISKANDFLSLVGLDNKKDHKPEELSGGEMQRVAVARALISKPSIILADEPTGNLDSQNTMDVIKLLKELSADMNHTVLLVTHNDEIASIGNRLIHLKDGQITS